MPRYKNSERDSQCFLKRDQFQTVSIDSNKLKYIDEGVKNMLNYVNSCYH
jgi:hypothetical protein